MAFSKASLLSLLILPFLVLSAYPPEDRRYWDAIGQKNLEKQLKRFKHQAAAEKKPKNIILFIGDGMGLTAIAAARLLYAEKMGRTGQYSDYPSFFESFPVTGISKTSCLDYHVTDSAAGAVALLTGRKVEINTLNLMPGSPIDCSQWETSGIIEETIQNMFLKKGGNVGVVTTSTITQATPAAMYAQSVHRKYENDVRTKEKAANCAGKDIALQLLNSPADKFKVIMGGAAQYLKGNRHDGRDIFEEWMNLPGKRRILKTKDDLFRYKAHDEDHVLGIFAQKHLDYKEDLIKKNVQPHLANMTVKAIEVLQKDLDKGYFLMVEGAKIDHAEHWLKMRQASDEVYEFDEAIKAAREMTSSEDTLIIVTADHSHAVGLPGYRPKNASLYGGVEIGNHLKSPGVVFVGGKDIKLTYSDEEGGKRERERERTCFLKNVTILAKTDFKSPAMYISDASFHGAEDVPIYADGPFSWLFSGSMENTEVAYRMKYLLCLQEGYECDEKEPTKQKEIKPKEDNQNEGWNGFYARLSMLFKW